MARPPEALLVGSSVLGPDPNSRHCNTFPQILLPDTFPNAVIHQVTPSALSPLGLGR